jgi:hypothetical protein
VFHITSKNPGQIILVKRGSTVLDLSIQATAIYGFIIVIISSRDELCSAIKLTRRKNKNTLSGLTIEKIVGMVGNVLEWWPEPIDGTYDSVIDLLFIP